MDVGFIFFLFTTLVGMPLLMWYMKYQEDEYVRLVKATPRKGVRWCRSVQDFREHGSSPGTDICVRPAKVKPVSPEHKEALVRWELSEAQEEAMRHWEIQFSVQWPRHDD